jgi:hypothetical protein
MARNKRVRWYGIQGQSQSRSSAFDRSSGTRRIASLVLLLVLVLILIQQTSDKRKVERVATAIGLLPNPSLKPKDQPLDSDQIRTAGSVDLKAGQDSTLRADSATDTVLYEGITIDTRDADVRDFMNIWNALLKRTSPPNTNSLARKVFANQESVESDRQSSEAKSDLPDWYAESQVLLSQWSFTEFQNAEAIVVKEQSAPARSPLARFSEWFRENEKWLTDDSSTQSIDSSDPIVRGFRLSLDRKLLGQVLDGSPWHSTERLSFVRSWQRIAAFRDALASSQLYPDQFGKTDFARIGSGGSELRGQPMRFDGTIVRVDRSGAISEPGFGKWEYQVLWLKPNDESNQPVCVYAPNLNVDSNIEIGEGSEVGVTGFYFKRIAYASKRGSDVGPIVLAAYVGPTLIAKSNSAKNLFATSSEPPRERRAWVPPVDFLKPYALVRQSLAPIIHGLSEPLMQSGFATGDVSPFIKPLLELERLAPEVKLLTSSDPNWPIENKSSLFRGSGWVTQVERLDVDRALVPNFEKPFVYRCQVEAISDESSFVVLCASLPSAWEPVSPALQTEIRQPCAWSGIRIDNETEPDFVWARSLEWRRDLRQQGESQDIDPKKLIPALSESELFLLTNGWDLAWNDLIRDLQNDPIKSLSPAELEPYYALMKIAKNVPWESWGLDQTIPTKTANDLLTNLRPANKQSSKPILERTALDLRIVRITRVPVPDMDQASMLGSDHYFQIDAMADIGNRSYEIPAGKQPIIYDQEYPVTCVAIELPVWLLEAGRTDASKTKSESQIADSRADGVWFPRIKAKGSGWFYRFWSYKTHEISQSLGEKNRQISPLVVLDSIDRAISKSGNNDWIVGWIANSASAILGLAGVIGIWWYVRTRTQKRTLRLNRTLPH